MKVALLSNVTITLLADLLKSKADVYIPTGFDIWQQEIIDTDSGLYAYNPESVVLLFYADTYADTWHNRNNGCSTINEWICMIQTLAARMPGIPIFVSSIDITNVTCHFGAEERLESYFENHFIEQLQQLHTRGYNVYILPVKEAVTVLGRNSFYYPKMWYVGSMPYSLKGLNVLAELITRYTTAACGAKKKCIAVDMDNTLWGGVIGEEGVNGIQLSNNKEGARYKDTQRILKKMKEQGVMIVILSKNNPEDVEPVFFHPDMVLRHADFVAEAINWEPKTVNIRRLAEELNIGLDSFVFLDDSPSERERMKVECPEVVVIDFPKDSAQLPAVVAKVYDDYFFSLEVTVEDVKKTSMYHAEAMRKIEMSKAVSMGEFLKNLEMTIDIHFMKPEEEKRVTQLTNKTNQFNVTTKRYSEEEIHRLAAADNTDIITVHMADKYGDQGLVAVLILEYEKDVAEIDTYLMSCRVMGRKAENEIMARIKGLLKLKGITTVKASYIKTAKNAPVLDLFEKLGFETVSGEIKEIGDRKDYTTPVDSLPVITNVFLKVLAGDWQ